MRRAIVLLAAIALAACSPAAPTGAAPAATTAAMQTATVNTSAALASCERARANNFGYSSSTTGIPSDVCACIQRTLTARDFVLMGQVFEIMALQVSSDVREYRFNDMLAQMARLETPGASPTSQPSASAISALRDRITGLWTMLGNECVPSQNSYPAEATTEAPYYPEDGATTPDTGYYGEEKKEEYYKK